MHIGRITAGLAGCVSIIGAVTAHQTHARQVASPRPVSEVAAKVSLAEVGLPAGAVSVSRFVYAPGISMPPHTHTGRTSIITIVRGQLTERRGDVVNVYKAGDVVTVAEGATHANENAGKEDLVYVEVNISGTVPRPVATPAK